MSEVRSGASAGPALLAAPTALRDTPRAIELLGSDSAVALWMSATQVAQHVAIERHYSLTASGTSVTALSTIDQARTDGISWASEQIT